MSNLILIKPFLFKNIFIDKINSVQALKIIDLLTQFLKDSGCLVGLVHFI